MHEKLIAKAAVRQIPSSQRPLIRQPRRFVVIGLLGECPRMSYMEMILTDQCNLRCSYCFEKDKNPHKMSDETAMASVDFLMEASGPTKKLTLLFFGGEPLLRFDLMQKVWEYATKRADELGKKINWNMTTNGTLVTEEKAR